VKQDHARGWNGRHRTRRSIPCVICDGLISTDRSTNAKTCSPACQQERIRRYHLDYNRDNAERRGEVECLRRYGLTPEGYREILQGQGHECAICRTVVPPFVVDHDHESGQVRGILCSNCNVMLGLAADSTAILERAAHYLEQSRAATAIGQA
jgi:hypothetical protein